MGERCDCVWYMPTGRELLDSLMSRGSCHPAKSGFLGFAEKLLSHHREQWRAEDDIRRHYDDDNMVATLKRKVDAMNTARVALVEELDEWVAENVAVATLDVPLHTETIGSVVDRLTIAFIRSETFRRLEADRSRSEIADRQLGELAHAYDDLVRDLREGKRRVPGWRVLKSYEGSRR